MTAEEKVEKIQEIIKLKVTGVYEANHDTSGHRYLNTKTGHRLRSVTTKLQILSKPHLLRWAVKVAIEWLQVEDRWTRLNNEAWHEEMISGAQMAHLGIRDEAGGVGTIAHDAAERYENDWIASGEQPKDIKVFLPENADPRSVASARAVEMFFKKRNVIPIASEILVGDVRYSAGQLDLLCLLDGKLTLIDHKTSNGVDEISYAMQVAAYKYFFEKMTGLKIQQVKILHLSKDYDKFTIYNVKYLPQAFKAFRHVCGLYDWMYDNRKVKIEKDIKRLAI